MSGSGKINDLESAKEHILEATNSAGSNGSRLDDIEELVPAHETLLLLLELDLARASSNGKLASKGVEGVAGEARGHLAKAAAH